MAQLEEKVTKHGHPNMVLNEHDLNMEFDTQIEGINMMQLFSLAKRNPIQRSKESIKESLSYESLKK